MKNVPVIGLAGGIGSGKSTIAKYFHNLGVHYVDADDVAREIVQPGSDCLRQIHQHFGDHVLLSDGSLNRKKLREIIFSNLEEKAWLENITHPGIRERIQILLQQGSSPYALLVHPLLFETRQNKICSLTIAIDVPPEIQLKRVMERDNITKDHAQKIINSQYTNNDRLQRADWILENTGNFNDLNDKVIELNKKILELI